MLMLSCFLVQQCYPASQGIQETSFTYCTSHNGPSTPNLSWGVWQSASNNNVKWVEMGSPHHASLNWNNVHFIVIPVPEEKEKTARNLQRAIRKIKVKTLKGSSSNTVDSGGPSCPRFSECTLRRSNCSSLCMALNHNQADHSTKQNAHKIIK